MPSEDVFSLIYQWIQRKIIFQVEMRERENESHTIINIDTQVFLHEGLFLIVILLFTKAFYKDTPSALPEAVKTLSY